MSIIAILPSAVADQIAAGEVVERPASVVKELVENSLDAGATSIEIAVEDGGRQLIRVADDGSGMAMEDARLALERHATSKIRLASDLVGVSSFGFRGEALPAICSVSELELITAAHDGAGFQVRASRGEVQGVVQVSRRQGTTVQVRALFHNTPARRKFLRGARSEWRAIADTVITMALVRRDVRFRLEHDGREAMSLPAVSSLRARVAGVWGNAYAESLLEVDDVTGPHHIHGLVDRPSDVGTRTRRVHLVVNGRAIRDTGMVRAAESAYRTTIPAGVRPSLFLELVLPAGSVDVNVHPAKAEVRFHDRWEVERAVERAVRRALGVMDSAPGMRTGHGTGWRQVQGVVPAATLDMLRTPARHNEPLFDTGEAPSGVTVVGRPTTLEGVPEFDESVGSVDAEPTDDAPIPPLIQLRRTYMMFEHDDGVVLIDQHAAHERVLYERFMGALERGDWAGQRLLFPITLHLGPAEAEAFEQNRELFEKIGFEIEGFGGHTLIVNAVPRPHARFDAERCLRDTLDSLTGDRMPGVHARHELLAATVACKAAVKAGDTLSHGEMQSLYRDLRACTLPAHDVHGRSVLVHLSWNELERRFGRQ